MCSNLFNSSWFLILLSLVIFEPFESCVVFLFLTCISIALLMCDVALTWGPGEISDHIFCSFLKARLLFYTEISSHFLDARPLLEKCFVTVLSRKSVCVFRSVF